MRNEESNEDTIYDTIVNAALVCRISVEKWPSVRKLVKDLGGELIFQKLAPAGVLLWIVEKEREPLGALR